MLEAAGIPLLREGGAVGVVGPVDGLSLPDIEVPGDFSSAAEHLLAGALLGDRRCTWTRSTSAAQHRPARGELRRMSVDVREEPGAPVAGEPCGALVVSRTEEACGHSR